MTNQAWQKLSKEQKEKWEKLTTRIEAQDRVVQEDFEDLPILNFEKIIPNHHFRGT
ncbi:MAG: hypothetical protein CEN92_285 [Candidatus Berkelbacteria bacterium Licking1014_96]|uniref:Uncharacterized protein n=1 Tax=Candidatus Berkelbacteria bacterium Licking1014_96 TaxID=2017149 RepID=A0A554LF51_9BACT|nr:MAG: hypothetical protein CEN92_285 [Candidatus Berkelbacteria bacterium Licking1014_96]